MTAIECLYHKFLGLDTKASGRIDASTGILTLYRSSTRTVIFSSEYCGLQELSFNSKAISDEYYCDKKQTLVSYEVLYDCTEEEFNNIPWLHQHPYLKYSDIAVLKRLYEYSSK